MDYILEVARIIDGAVKGDKVKVMAYSSQLARKLGESGDHEAAQRVVDAATGTVRNPVKLAEEAD